MKLLFSVCLFVLITQISWAQNVEIQNNLVKIDKKKWSILEKKGCETPEDFCAYIFYDLKKKDFLIAANVFTYHQPATIDNPQSNEIFYYLNLSFNGFERTAEIDFSNQNMAAVIALLHQEKLIVNGKLNAEQVQQFIKKEGTKYSDKNPSVLILKEAN